MNPELSKRLERLREAWAEAGCVVRPAATEGDLRNFERLHDVRVPADVAAYFLSVDGMNEGEHDTHLIRFWPLTEVKPAITEMPEGDPSLLANYFVFADYSLWAHAYAVRLGAGPGDVVILGGENPIAIAPTFVEFLDAYAERPELLF